MFTTGSKFFFGAAAVALFATMAYGIASGWEFSGVMILISVVVAGALLGSVVVAFRDVNQPASAAADVLVAPSHVVAPYSMWPIVGAFVAAVTVLGLALDRRIFILGVLLIIAVTAEWMVTAWADRASADPAYNRSLRSRFMHPLEFPVLGALSVGFVIFMFSRLMLAVNENAAVVAFIVIGAVILGVSVLLSTRPKITVRTLAPILAVAAAGLLVLGIVGLSKGERKTLAETEEKASKAVAAKSNVAVRLSFADGKPDKETIVLVRSNPSNILFTNDGPGERKLVIEAEGPVKQSDGSVKDGPVTIESEVVGEGKTALLTVRLVRSGTFSFKIEPVGGGGEIAASGQVVVA